MRAGFRTDWLQRCFQERTHGERPHCYEQQSDSETDVAETAAGRVDTDFWRSFFRYESGSGPAELTGWIVTLFPYLKTGRNTDGLARSTYLSTWREHFRIADSRGNARVDRNNIQGPAIDLIPGSLASAPVRFIDVRDDSEAALRFVAGMLGVRQDAGTGALAPAFGWAVVHDVPALPPPRPDLVDPDIDEVTGARRKR